MAELVFGEDFKGDVYPATLLVGEDGAIRGRARAVYRP
jgi:hypothetical protein